MEGNSNIQGVIMQGVGLLFIGISTIFFSVLIGFFKTMVGSGISSTWVGLPQVVPVTPLIIWVVMILLGVVAIGAGEKSLLTQPGKYADFMLVGIGMLFLGISVVFFSVTLGFFTSLMATSGLSRLHRTRADYPRDPVNHLGDGNDPVRCQHRRRRLPDGQES